MLFRSGNPGPEYADTRHNAGFWWIDQIARQLGATLAPERAFHGHAARASVQGQSVWLLKPQTFMNLSGKAVAALARFYKIAPQEILRLKSRAESERDGEIQAPLRGQDLLAEAGSFARINFRLSSEDQRLLTNRDETVLDKLRGQIESTLFAIFTALRDRKSVV